MAVMLVLALGLVVCSAPIVHGAQYLTVNKQPVDSIILEVGQSCFFEVVSDDSMVYTDVIGFEDSVVLGSFLHYKTTKEAGDSARVTPIIGHDFYGYEVTASGFITPPSPGTHFIFEYQAQEPGETDLVLKDGKSLKVLDSVHIRIVPDEMGTAFTYQGRLIDSNTAADGEYDFEFELYDAPFAGGQLGSTIDVNDLDVIDGYFTVELDFGSDVFDGNAVWLEIGVRPGELNDPNVYTTLSPRQELTPTPYALYAETAGYAQSAGGIPGGISGSGTANYIAKFTGSDTLGDSAIYEEAGNVGIGTASPGARLEVNGQVKVTGGSPAAGKVLTSDADGLATWQTPSIGGDSDWLISGNDMYSIPSGKVGIGTTTPAAKLEVAGDVKISGSSSGGTIAATNSDASGYGVYGVATTGGDVTNYGGYFESPSKFGGGVYGLATNSYGGKGVWGKATGDAGIGVYGETLGNINPAVMGVASNTSAGKGVLGKADGTSGIGLYGVASAASGTNYGVYGTTNSPTGYAGYFSGNINTTASYKIGGQNAISVSGTDSLSIGPGAGANNTGSHNTFSGYSAGYFNTTGYANTFSGYSAGYFNTTGNYNTFLGNWAGYSNTEGGANTFTGYLAGYNNTTGCCNTFSGLKAGYSNTEGTGNTFSGHQAGLSNTEGTGNTFSGASAGYYNTTGTGNVFIGNNAGYYETGSDKLYIDNSGTFNPLIYGDFASDLVEINGTLDVKGPIWQRGGVLHADYVFRPDYELESIDKHSEFMWQNKHLPAIPKAMTDENGREIVEVGAHRRGIVEELEKAHIYIDQLHKQNIALETRLAKLEVIVAQMSIEQKGKIK